MNDAEFIDGLRRQDPVAARHLNECFVPAIWRFVYFRVDRDSHVAEDIVGEAVLALVTAAASDSQIEHPAAWLRTVALRRIQDHFRAAARVQHLIEQVQPNVPSDEQADPSAKHDQDLQRQSVRDAMDLLPATYRSALEWKYVDRVSVRTIAKRLDTTEKGAESTLFRARRALRDRLQNDGAAEPPVASSRKTRTQDGTNEKPTQQTNEPSPPSGATESREPSDERSHESKASKPPPMSYASRLAGES